MIIATDLTDWGLEPLDWLAEGLSVKPRLKKYERSVMSVLAGLFAEGCDPAIGAVENTLGDWDGIAVVDDAAGSQYDALLAVAREQKRLPGPVAAVALGGRGFHGNRGRPWRAARGNLHLCCALPVDLDASRCAAAVPAVPAVAVCDALKACAPDLSPRIKWVNDVLVDGAKIAGVLAGAQSRGPVMTSLVYGVGVNVAVTPEVEPTLFVPRVTSLHAHEGGGGVTLGRLTGALLEALWSRLQQVRDDGAGPVVDAYRSYCGDVGRRVRVWAEGLPDVADAAALPAPMAAGRVLALDDDLALHVEGSSGPIVGGRLAHHDEPEPTP